jgi:hypothetical protein
MTLKYYTDTDAMPLRCGNYEVKDDNDQSHFRGEDHAMNETYA